MLQSSVVAELLEMGQKQEDCFLIDNSLQKKQTHLYSLALCAIFRDEASYLKEWIEFHKLVGVQHFYLYNNLSKDDYLEILKPYIKEGDVELYDWPYESEIAKEWTSIQTGAYRHALKKCLGKTKWLAILDTDEFLFPLQEDNLVDFLKNYEEFAGICVNWQMYGTSGVHKVPPNQLMIDMLLLKAPTLHAENRFVKSIVRPEAVDKITDPHFVHYKKGFSQVDTHKVKCKGSTTNYIHIDLARINHYWTRDEWFFYHFKCPRRQKWQEGFDGQINRMQTLNQVYDDTILRFVPMLKQRILTNSQEHE